MALFVKDAGVWKESGGGGLSIKDASTWKQVQNGFVKDGGVWKEFYTNIISWVSVVNAQFSPDQVELASNNTTISCVRFPLDGINGGVIYSVSNSGTADWGLRASSPNPTPPSICTFAIDPSSNTYCVVDDIGSSGRGAAIFKINSSGSVTASTSNAVKYTAGNPRETEAAAYITSSNVLVSYNEAVAGGTQVYTVWDSSLNFVRALTGTAFNNSVRPFIFEGSSGDTLVVGSATGGSLYLYNLANLTTGTRNQLQIRPPGFGTSNRTELSCLGADIGPSNEVVACGTAFKYVNNSFSVPYNAFITKINSNNTVAWSVEFGNWIEPNRDIRLDDVKVDTNGDIYATGIVQFVPADQNFRRLTFIVKFNSSGSLIYAYTVKQAGGLGAFNGSNPCLAVKTNGSLVGYFNTPSEGVIDCVFQLPKDGSKIGTSGGGLQFDSAPVSSFGVTYTTASTSISISSASVVNNTNQTSLISYSPISSTTII